MIRLLSISRSGPLILSMNDLFLSISTGLLLILHYNYYVPLLASTDNQYSLYSILYSIFFISIIKTFFSLVLTLINRKKVDRTNHKNRQITFKKLLYSAAIKIATYLCFFFLIITINSITFSLTLFITLLFIFFLQCRSKDNKIMKILWKGRSLGSSKIKNIVICILTIVTVLLQPLDLVFLYQLHFEVFIIFTTSLMIFSYYFIQKLIVVISSREYMCKIFFESGCLQCVYLMLLIGYYALIQQNGLQLKDQIKYIGQNIIQFIGLMLLNILYQIVLIETLKKVSLNRLVISQTTGLLWFNIYQMTQTIIQLQHYISVIIMFFILLVNIQLFSQNNIKQLLDKFSNSKKKKKKNIFTEMEIKQNQNQH